MTFELAIATMGKTLKQVFEMLETMNVHCDCLIINQCGKDDYYEEYRNSQKIRIIFTKERGLSKSRNMALKNGQADILGIADDDLCYYDGFDQAILDYYQNNSNIDIVLFNIDDYYKNFSSRSHICNFFELSGYISMQCTLRLQSIRTNNLQFNELFGTGSEYFNSGEENIFLADCWRAKLKIAYCNNKILRRDECESSWFTGFNDESFIFTRGAIYYAISKYFFFLYIIRFAVKYRKRSKPYTIIDTIKLMLKGRDKYLNILFDK